MDYTTTSFLTVLIVVGGAEAARITQGKPLVIKPVVSGFLLGLFLFVFGIFSENLGTKIAYLIIVASLLVNGIPLVSAISAQTK
jgi:hypothetical protein